MTGMEFLIITIFGIFLSWILIKPEGVLSLVKRVYTLLGIQVSYSKRSRIFVRIAAILALLISIFGIYQQLNQ